jgi:hypothetical protein
MKSIQRVSGETTIGPAQQQDIERRVRTLERGTEPYIVTKDYTFRDSDTIDSLQVDATAGNITITLPSPTGNRRRRVIKTDSSTNTVSIVGLINADSSYTLYSQYRFVEVEPTGVAWIVVSWGSIYTSGQGDVFTGKGTLATGATTGFLYVPTCAGTPTGVPSSVGAYVPIVINTTNNKLYFYSSGAWRDAGP